MTVIASFCIKNSPFLISDLLISVKASPKNRIFKNQPEPIRKFSKGLPQTAKYTITGVRQKTLKITNRFFIAYSGIVSSADEVVHHFQQLVKTTTPTGELFESEMAKLESEKDLSGLNLLVLIEHAGNIYTGGYNFNRYRSKKFRSMKICGSGIGVIQEIFGSYRGKVSNRSFNQLEEGLGLSLALSSSLSGKEYITGEPLEKAFGGFYEITYWEAQRFRKLANILHVHWLFEHRPSEGVAFYPPVRVQKLEYHGSTLYVREIDFEGSSKSNDTVYIVTDPSKNSAKGARRLKPKLSYKWKVDHLYIALKNGKVRYENNVEYVHSNDYSLKLVEKASKLELNFKSDYFERVLDILCQSYIASPI